jgi:hypothetical protein
MKIACIEVAVQDEHLEPGADSQVIQIATKNLRLAGYYHLEALNHEIDSIVWNNWQKGYLENESEQQRHERLQREEDDLRKKFWESHRTHRIYNKVYVK